MSEDAWKIVCRVGSGALTLGRWRQELAGAFPVCRRWIEKTGRPVGNVKRGQCGCNHRVVPDMDGDGFVAVCTCGAGGEPVAMTEAKARAWVLNGRAVVKEMASVLPVEMCVKAVGRHLLWEIGSGWTLTGQRRRVLVSLAGKRAVLEAALGDLYSHKLRDFLLLVADPQWCGSDLGSRLESVGGEVHAIGGFIGMRAGGLVPGTLVKKILLVSVGDGAMDGVLRPLRDWNEVILNGVKISLRQREKAKDFLRHLWARKATRRSAAIIAGKRFEKPSSLFPAGVRYERDDRDANARDVPVTSALGEMICSVYREGVGKVAPDKKGKGPAKYYLKVYRDSDST